MLVIFSLFLQTENGRFEFDFSLNQLVDLFTYEATVENLKGRKFNFTATVNETLTGKAISVTEMVEFDYFRYTIKWLDVTPKSFKPGMNFTAYVSNFI